jgi:hypothetical protein
MSSNNFVDISVPFSRKCIQDILAKRQRDTPCTIADIKRLDLLPSNVLEQVLSFLDTTTLFNIGQSCSSLLSILADSSTWYHICKRRWSIPDPQVVLTELELSSYNAMFVALCSILPLQGCWQLLQDYPCGHIILLRYESGRLIAEKYPAAEAGTPSPRLFAVSMAEQPARSGGTALHARAAVYDHDAAVSAAPRHARPPATVQASPARLRRLRRRAPQPVPTVMYRPLIASGTLYSVRARVRACARSRACDRACASGRARPTRPTLRPPPSC